MRLNTTIDMGWYKRGSIITATTFSPILRYISLLSIQVHVHASINHITSKDNRTEDAADYCLAHFTNSALLAYFCIHPPHLMTWCLLQIPYKCRWKLTSMINGNGSTKIFSLGQSKGHHHLEVVARLLRVDPHPH